MKTVLHSEHYWKNSFAVLFRPYIQSAAFNKSAASNQVCSNQHHPETAFSNFPHVTLRQIQSMTWGYIALLHIPFFLEPLGLLKILEYIFLVIYDGDKIF